MSERISLAAGILCILLVLFSGPLKWMLRLAVSALIGGLLLLCLNRIGLPLGVNAITVTWCTLLGLPGLSGLVVLCLLL